MATGNTVTIGSVRVSSSQQNPTRVRNIQYIPPGEELGPVYSQINTVSLHANAAFNTANLKFNSAGGTISGNVTVNGDFIVNGNTVYTNTQILLINDNIITLNANAYGTPIANAGIEVARGSQPNTLLIWSEVDKSWLITNTGTGFEKIAIGSYANGAYAQANAAFQAANNVTPQIQPSFNQANAAYATANAGYATANAAYVTANTKVSKSGDTMTGDLKFAGGGGILNLPTNQIALTANVDNDASGFIAFATGVATVYANTDVIIQANTGGTNSQWNFNKDGTLIFPDSTIQSTAFTGSAIDQVARNAANAANVLAQNAYNYANTLGINVANSLIIVTTAPANNKGAGGDTKGMVYLANDYFYYCTTAHDGTTNIWSRIASTDAW